MPPHDLSWLTPEIEATQAYHRARIARLYAGDPPGEVIALAGKSFGRSHGLAGTHEIDMLAQPEAWLDDVLADMAHTVADRPAESMPVARILEITGGERLVLQIALDAPVSHMAQGKEG